MATKVLLDTDIGSDIDDAVALAYLLAPEAPQADVLAELAQVRMRGLMWGGGLGRIGRL